MGVYFNYGSVVVCSVAQVLLLMWSQNNAYVMLFDDGFLALGGPEQKCNTQCRLANIVKKILRFILKGELRILFEI